MARYEASPITMAKKEITPATISFSLNVSFSVILASCFKSNTVISASQGEF